MKRFFKQLAVIILILVAIVGIIPYNQCDAASNHIGMQHAASNYQQLKSNNGSRGTHGSRGFESMRDTERRSEAIRRHQRMENRREIHRTRRDNYWNYGVTSIDVYYNAIYNSKEYLLTVDQWIEFIGENHFKRMLNECSRETQEGAGFIIVYLR